MLALSGHGLGGPFACTTVGVGQTLLWVGGAWGSAWGWVASNQHWEDKNQHWVGGQVLHSLRHGL